MQNPIKTLSPICPEAVYIIIQPLFPRYLGTHEGAIPQNGYRSAIIDPDSSQTEPFPVENLMQ